MWEKLSLWHTDLIPLMFHSRGTAGSYISPIPVSVTARSMKCSLWFPWGSLSSIFLIKVSLTVINTSPLSFVFSLWASLSQRPHVRHLWRVSVLVNCLCFLTITFLLGCLGYACIVNNDLANAQLETVPSHWKRTLHHADSFSHCVYGF